MERALEPWTKKNLVDQSGRIALVTGSNTGLGFEVARGLAQKGATVILACRNLEKAQSAVEQILTENPDAKVSKATLDLSDLVSVSTFANSFIEKHERLDLLINNAGVMATPLSRTKQGFEQQIGTNFLGHFALTAQLFPVINKTLNGRIVCVSSSASKIGRIDFKDFNFEKRKYAGWQAYAQSKIAILYFGLELARKLNSAQSKVKVTMAHPGYTATDLQRDHWFMKALVNPFFMKPEEGASSILRASCDLNAPNGSYWGPRNFFEMVGAPVQAEISKRAQDPVVAGRLWALAEELTGQRFEV